LSNPFRKVKKITSEEAPERGDRHDPRDRPSSFGRQRTHTRIGHRASRIIIIRSIRVQPWKNRIESIESAPAVPVGRPFFFFFFLLDCFLLLRAAFLLITLLRARSAAVVWQYEALATS